MSALKKTAETSVPIDPLISERWSPRAFADRPVEPEKLRALFEAARWAASSYNGQPWYFIVGTKDGPANYQRVLVCLVEFNHGWAKQAPVLALAVAQLKFDHNGEPNRHGIPTRCRASGGESSPAGACVRPCRAPNGWDSAG